MVRKGGTLSASASAVYPSLRRAKHALWEMARRSWEGHRKIEAADGMGLDKHLSCLMNVSELNGHPQVNAELTAVDG